MRMLKFRTWNIIENKFNGSHIKNVKHVGEVLCQDGIHIIPDCYSRNLIVQEFSGFLDKNGKEVYEGDIIKCKEWMGGSMKDREIPEAAVIFTRGAFWFSLDKIRNYKNPHQLLYYAIDMEVTGNIFEIND